MAGKGLAGLLALVLFLIVAGGGIFAALNPERVQCLFASGDAVEQCDFKQTADGSIDNDLALEENLVEPVQDVLAYELPPTQDMLRERVLGFANAPIKISEHSSLTCSHCGHFHKNTYNQIKDNFIANGKAYLVFSDFPLNGPALYASMVTRCAPEEKYFDFIQELFERQEEWAYDVSYLDFLKERAAEYGLPNEQFSQCIKNDELRQGLLAQVAETQKNHDVSSTPTFVINDQDIIAGSVSYETFKAKFDGILNPSVDQQLENAVRDVTAPVSPNGVTVPSIEMPVVDAPVVNVPEVPVIEVPVIKELPTLSIPEAPAVPPASAE